MRVTSGHLGQVAKPDFWRTYVTLSMVIFGGFVAVGSAGPFHSLYAVSLGATLGQVALVGGGYVTVALFAGLWWGRIADDPARRRGMMVASLACLAALHGAVALVSQVPPDAMPFAFSPWWLLVPLRLIEGAIAPANQVASMAMMGELLDGDPRRPRLVSAYRMSGSLAFSVAIVASGTVSQAVGPAGSFVVAGVTLVLATIAAASLPASTRVLGSGGPVRTRSIGFVELTSGPMRPVLVLALAFGLPFSMVYAVWPIWIANERGLGQATYSQLWGLAALVEVPCMILAGWLVSRIGSARTFSLGLATFACVYAAYALAPPLEALFVVQVLRGFSFAAYTATSLTMAIELAPRGARGRAAGLYQSAQGLAQILGNWTGPPIAGSVGFAPVFAIASAGVLCGAAYALRAVLPTAATSRDRPVS